jgi:hypothetical protein
VIAHETYRFFDTCEIARRRTEPRILEADADMTAARDRLADQGADALKGYIPARISAERVHLETSARESG